MKKLRNKITIISMVALVIATWTITIMPKLALADPPHCSKPGYPSCYNVGFADGRADVKTKHKK